MKAFLLMSLLALILSACSGAATPAAATPTSEPSATPVAYRQPEVTVWALQAAYQEQKVLNEYAGLIREVNFVWYNLTGNNQITGKNANPKYVKELQQAGVRVVPAIQNNGFIPSYIHTMVSDPAARAQHIRELVEIVVREGYDGIDIDYESMNLEDKDDYSLFIEELYAAMHLESKLLSVTVHPKTSDEAAWESAQAQDWRRLGAASDMFKIMVYDYSSGPGQSGPIAPVAWAEQVIDYAVSVVEAKKVYLGLPFYGYDYAAGAKRSVTWVSGNAAAQRYGAAVQRDESNEAWFTYDSGGTHTVYFNDALATRTKVEAIWAKHPDLRGVSIWVLGSEDPENWAVLRELFVK